MNEDYINYRLREQEINKIIDKAIEAEKEEMFLTSLVKALIPEKVLKDKKIIKIDKSYDQDKEQLIINVFAEQIQGVTTITIPITITKSGTIENFNE